MTTGRINQVAFIRDAAKCGKVHKHTGLSVRRLMHLPSSSVFMENFERSKIIDPHTLITFRIRENKQALKDRNDPNKL